MNYISKDDRYNNRLYSVGASLELMGKREEALIYYRQLRKDYTDDNEWEKYWYRRLSIRVERPLVYTDSLLIAADNNRAIGKLDESIKDYLKLNSLDQLFTDDINVQINSGMGQVYFKQKDFNKAIEEFKKNLSLNPAEEKWLVPDSHFQIGRCYLRLGNKAAAKEWFDKAEDIDYNYDFKDAMDTKIKNELSKNG